MRPYELIMKKRDGKSLKADEIKHLIEGYSRGDIPDYQMSAWAMAVYFQGMGKRETAELTKSMAESGEQVDLSAIPGIKVDKHSTGGVGDTTTLILGPLVASTGVPVAKMSGRGLGHTGGTIDKLESIPGFNTELRMDDFISAVKQRDIAVVGQTGNLTPADKKLYALRDVTATVDSIPLIASSIMSKKIAGGADGIVLDVKTGSGAFMSEYDSSRELAETMVNIGKEVGRETIAVITDMDQPLGYAVGNALEVKEAISTLKGEGPEDLTELCLVLGANMLIIAGKVNEFEKGYNLLKEKIESGQALEKFRDLIAGQQGNVEVIDDPKILPEAEQTISVKSSVNGFIKEIRTQEIGLISTSIGAGRKEKGEIIDHSAGIVFNIKSGDEVAKGEELAKLHFNDINNKDEVIERFKDAIIISSEEVEDAQLIKEIIK